MEDANPVRLPMAAGCRMKNDGEALPKDLTTVYQELVGGLLYLSTCTRPDITFAVGQHSRYVAAPTTNHLTAAKTVLRYLKGTAYAGLTYGAAAEMVGFCDADYAGDLDTRRSTTGYVFV